MTIPDFFYGAKTCAKGIGTLRVLRGPLEPICRWRGQVDRGRGGVAPIKDLSTSIREAESATYWINQPPSRPGVIKRHLVGQEGILFWPFKEELFSEECKGV